MYDKKIKAMFIIISVLLVIGFGTTLAYFTSSTDFENEFHTGLYQTQATETFTSPENWLPGDETPKTLTITNSGNVDVKARVCISENWESANGETLPNKVNGESAAIINLDNTDEWTKRGNCYVYNDTLEPSDTTSSFISSVTFNPNVEASIYCEPETNNGITTKTCESTGNGYDNATYTLKLTVETIQADVADDLWNPIHFVSKQNQNQITVGDEIRIDTEHFYVVSSDSNKTVLLAKYNLLVGDIYHRASSEDLYFERELSSADDGYGLQSNTAIGYVSGNHADYTGTVGFSGTNYWDNSVCYYTGVTMSCSGTNGLLIDYSQNGETYYSNPHDNDYPYAYNNSMNQIALDREYVFNDGYAYAKNNGYTIAYFVKKYLDKLKELGAPESISGRLLSMEEAINLGCDVSNSTCKNSPATAPSWVYSSSYWLGSVKEYYSTWNIYSDGRIYAIGFYDCTTNGVRPVIEIPTSELN